MSLGGKPRKWVEQTVTAVFAFILAGILALFGAKVTAMGYGEAATAVFGACSALIILGGAALVGPEDALEVLQGLNRAGRRQGRRGRA